MTDAPKAKKPADAVTAQVVVPCHCFLLTHDFTGDDDTDGTVEYILDLTKDAFVPDEAYINVDPAKLRAAKDVIFNGKEAALKDGKVHLTLHNPHAPGVVQKFEFSLVL